MKKDKFKSEIEKFLAAGGKIKKITAEEVSNQPIKLISHFSFRKKKGWSGESPKTFY